MEVITYSAGETKKLAFTLGRHAGKGHVFALMGPLGAGKTCFAQGLLAGLGVDEAVTSPTFTLIAEYVGRVPVIHIDAYRLPKAGEWRDLGLDDYLSRGTVLVAEWADLLGEILPADRLDIFISFAESHGPDARVVKFKPQGPQHTALLLRALKAG